jgi:AcrR family transcriptional regulator
MTVAAQVPRRRLTDRQVESIDALLVAAEAEVEEAGYDGLSVRSVARRAGVAPATAYNYLSSKDHLLAELLWRRVAAVPEVVVDPGAPLADRLEATVDALAAVTTGSPEVVAACTQALLSSNLDVVGLRVRIGAEIHRRIAAAAAPAGDAVAQVLVTTYFGALLSAGMGHMAYADVPAFVVTAARLMAAGED